MGISRWIEWQWPPLKSGWPTEKDELRWTSLFRVIFYASQLPVCWVSDPGVLPGDSWCTEVPNFESWDTKWALIKKQRFKSWIITDEKLPRFHWQSSGRRAGTSTLLCLIEVQSWPESFRTSKAERCWSWKKSVGDCKCEVLLCGTCMYACIVYTDLYTCDHMYMYIYIYILYVHNHVYI